MKNTAHLNPTRSPAEGTSAPQPHSVWRIALIVLAFALRPDHALALDTAETVSDKVTEPNPEAVQLLPAKVLQPDAIKGFKRADFANEQASADARHIADWVVDSRDNKGLPYVIIDKVDAKMFVFDAAGRLRGAAPVLLGLARGDHTVPGIGDRELSKIRPEERTTPAGRFVATRGMSTRGVDVVWVDYDSGVSLHRVINNGRDRRFERLATPTPADNRISYGCINVPIAFYNQVVTPSFNQSDGIIYVLPEVRKLSEVFQSYDVASRHQYAAQRAADQPAANRAVLKTSSTPQ